MLQVEKRNTLNTLLENVTQEELIWINGYISGVLSGGKKNTAAAGQILKKKLTLLFGTETGNAKSLALKLSSIGRKQGMEIKPQAIEQYRPSGLAKEENLLIVISTQGDGEPPQAAKNFYDYIHGEKLQLKGLHYGIIALGDSSYPFFCQTGVDVDQRLAALGAQRIQDVIKCDTDYENAALNWFEQFRERLSSSSAEVLSDSLPAAPKTSARTKGLGTVLKTINLNDRGSDKTTHHIEIDTDGVDYLPGDAIALTPPNPESLVSAILEQVQLSGTETIRYREQEYVLRELLQNHLNITRLSERTVKAYAGVVRQDIPVAKMSLIDLLRIYPVPEAAQFIDILQLLERQIPRQYSIASAPSVQGKELHLTVALDHYELNGEAKQGLCSDYLVQLKEGDQFEFNIHANPRFRPASPDTDMIMIGPGTGIAPFRSFLLEREAQMASGRNWLFFGDRRFTTDFLYQTEIQQWIETEVLHRFNAAFSRDQEEKVYVQHRMLEQSAALWEWIENGACIYICGARNPMSLDVEKTLLQIIANQGHKPEEAAQAYLDQMAESGRYLKDVY